MALMAAAVFSSCSTTGIENTRSGGQSEVNRTQIGSGGDEGATDFFVASVSPNEEVPSSVSFPSIQIQFSKPVVPIKKLGEPITKCDDVTITPKLNGVFRWYGTSLLSFDCSDELIPQKEYTISINPDLKSADGTLISGQTFYTFHTEELRLVSVEPGYTARKEKKLYLNPNDIPTEYARDIALTFSNKVNVDTITRYISVTDSLGTLYPYKASSADEKTVLLKMENDFPRNKEILVKMFEGAMPDTNCWPTSSEQSRSFHTLRPFEYSHTSIAEGATNPVIYFNHPIKAGSEKKIYSALSFSPALDFPPENMEIYGNTIRLRDLPVTYNDTYTLTLKSDSVSDAYDQVCTKKVSEEITVPDADSFARYKTSGLITMESQFEPKRAFEFQNIEEKSTYTITPIAGVTSRYKAGKSKTFDVMTTDETKNRRVIQVVELKDFLEKTAGGYRGALKFESNIFYNPYNASKKNPYTSTNKSYIQVTDLGLTVHSSWNKTAVFVTNLSTGKPVPNVKVTLKSFARENIDTQSLNMLAGGGKELAGAVSDKDGLAVLCFDAKKDYMAIRYLDATSEDDRVVMEIPSWWSSDGFTAASFEKDKIISATTGEELDPEKIQKGRNVTKIFSDRMLYRPGETASFKVIDRTLSLGRYSTYKGLYSITIKDASYWRSDSKSYAEFTGRMSEQGTTSGEWKIPEDLKPGNYYILYSRLDGSGFTAQESLSVQFFERLRFQASSEIAPVVYYSGDSISASVKASYLGGGSLAGGSVFAEWTRNPTSFRPAGEKYDGFTFGPSDYLYDWESYSEDDIDDDYDNFHESSSENLSPEGTAHVGVSTGSEPKKGYPYTYSLQAQVTDAGNQMIATRASALVHPASFYIGLSGIKGIKGFAKKGQKISFDYLLATPEGNTPDSKLLPKDKKISWKLSTRTWEEEVFTDEYGYEHSEWKTKIVTESSGNVNAGEGSLSVTPKEGGSYCLEMSCTDFLGRSVITKRTFYVTGSTLYRSYGNETQIQLMNDKNRYDVGDTAHIALESPLEKGSYLVTVEREGILSEKIITLEKSSTTIDVPIEESYIPTVWVSVSTFMNRSKEPPADYDSSDEGKPKPISASTTLVVSKKSRSFDVEVKTDKNCYTPGSDAKIDLTATKDGKPLANAELTLMAVDRGVLDLIGYHVGNPLENFYSLIYFNNRTYKSDSRTTLIDPVTYGTYTTSARERAVIYRRNDMMMKATASSRASEAKAEVEWEDDMVLEEASMMMADTAKESAAAEGEDEGAGPVMQIRKDFRATAVFLPNLVTDENGKVSAEFKLPDSLTEYVVTVVGVKENDYGYKEDKLTVANPISVRDVETRILRPGDNGEAGVVITNIGDESEDVSVEFEVISGLEKTDYVPTEGELVKLPGKASVSGEAKKSLAIKPGDTSTLMFRIDAQSAGWITLAFTVKSKSVNEIIYKRLEIEKPYIYETVTTVGQIDSDEKSADERIIFPAGTDDGRGSFYIQLDSTRLGTLRTAVDYVFRYPYGCLEQRSSAVMPLIAFGDYISVFGLKSEVENPKSVVESEIASWAEVQRKDGGFPYWPDGRESSFAVTLRIGEILALSKEHGIKVPSKLNQKQLVSYIRSELKKLDEKGWWYPKAYSYYVLSRLGEKIAAGDLTTILNSDTGISEYAFAGLAAVELGYKEQSALAVKKIKNLMSLTTRGASFQNSVPMSGWYFYNGNPERYALALHLFTKVDADDIYNGHLVWQLLEMEKAGKGRWYSTVMTSRVLIALDAYIRENKLEDTNLTATALIDGKKILDGKFKGLGAEPVEQTYRFGTPAPNTKQKDEKFSLEWPALDVPLETELPFEIKKDGKGKLFYTASMTYAIPAKEQTARDEGLCVYVEITDARTGERVAPGKLKSGTIYREKVFVTTTKERNYVAVRAPVPAGAEILNSAFVTTATVPNPESKDTSSKRLWIPRLSFSHQDIYDAEIRCFWNYLPIGSQNFEFLFRAQRTGEYETPAALAECMYEPEIFGRSNGEVWKIE